MIWRNVVAACAAGAVAVKVALDAALPESALLHPPGARHDGAFAAQCVKCGKCIEACPYQALHAAPFDAGAKAGTPVIDARAQACRLCDGFPCVAACPTGALSPVASREDVRMGTAVINRDLCLSYKAMRCEVCYRVCPFIDEAISINYGAREGDSTHAVFAPVIAEDKCVGCGLCVERCVVGEPECAIRIEPAT
ncbi:4Fe-4S dicluster domain-containing protein [Berryella wangjianweii]|uniref:4Fe-4S dicluster domain-containing protein n=1 Tax=Berryella wangjianweii TaxID=2734634 RepID=A0A6M8IZE0_9ACTN|nr:4Fe-4S dicluster domain-containing protein [Berryella wangjianweii]QKF07080.1 4Fe-4S dicluster domain-containing protein [Berryella wangjianweii]